MWHRQTKKDKKTGEKNLPSHLKSFQVKATLSNFILFKEISDYPNNLREAYYA